MILYPLNQDMPQSEIKAHKTAWKTIKNYYTAFNDAIQSFMSNIKCKTSLSKITSVDLSKLFFNAGKQKMILDQSTRVISLFLPSTSA